MSTYLLSIFLFLMFSYSTIKKFKKTPPGTVMLSDNYFVDDTEVTNFNWMEYLSWQKKHYGKESMEFRNALPDTTVWSEKMKENIVYYLRHPSFRDYPVVGVTLEQAINFCIWRTDRVNQYLYIKEMKFPISYADSLEIQYPKIYEYKIPTKSQWIEISQIPYVEKTLIKVLKNNERLGNYHVDTMNNNAVSFTKTVYSFYPNEKELYNVFGNVSELILDTNIVMGGSWKHSETESKNINGQEFKSPTDYIGFRCVAFKLK